MLISKLSRYEVVGESRRMLNDFSLSGLGSLGLSSKMLLGRAKKLRWVKTCNLMEGVCISGRGGNKERFGPQSGLWKNDECTVKSESDVEVHLSVISGGGKIQCRAGELNKARKKNGRLQSAI